MGTQVAKADRFLALHHDALRQGVPLLLVNAWDIGSARLLGGLGFEALATTSSGLAASLGQFDGSVGREESLAHAAAMVAATGLPVSADLQNGFADDPEQIADTVRWAISAGLAGCSIEDFSGRSEAPIYEPALAAERIAAAAAVAHDGPVHLVLTARADNYLHGRTDLHDTIARLVSYQEAGADVLYAPGLSDLQQVRSLVGALDRPVNVLLGPAGPNVAELAGAGVARVSVGGSFAFASLGALVEAARELRAGGVGTYFERAKLGLDSVRGVFSIGQDATGAPGETEHRGELSVLVPVTVEHVAELRRILRTPEVRLRWGGEDASVQWPFDDPPTMRFSIVVGGVVRGLVQYLEEEEPGYRHASIDIFLHPAVHGRGIGRDALATLARHLVHGRGHHRLVIDPAADNEPAVRCFASVGFRPVGVMRRYERDPAGGGWHDGLLMDLLAEDLDRPG